MSLGSGYTVLIQREKTHQGIEVICQYVCTCVNVSNAQALMNGVLGRWSVRCLWNVRIL